MDIFCRRSAHVLLISILGVLIYLNTLDAPFFFDDFTSLVEIPIIKSLSYFTHPDSAKMYGAYGGFISRYVGYLTFALNYHYHGYNVAGYHLVNIAIHLMAALLVYRLVILTFKSASFSEHTDMTCSRTGFIALFAALLFVVHPLQTQAVTYIVQRLASLSAMFYLLSITSYMQARLGSRGQHTRLVTGAWFAASICSFFLAIKTKQTAYTLPLAIVMYELLFFNSVLKKNLRKIMLTALGFLGTAGAGIIWWSLLPGRSIAEVLNRLDKASRLQTDMSRWDYLATQFRVMVTYLRLVLFPVGQNVDYDYPVSHSFFSIEVLLSALLLCSLIGCAAYCLYRARHAEMSHDDSQAQLTVIAFGIFWFFITHSIESGIIPIVDVIFEHRMYLPSAGLFMAIAAAVSLAGGRGTRLPGWPRGPVLAALAGVIILLSGTTVMRNQLWRNEAGLWEDTVRKSPKKGRTYLNLGSARERGGDIAGAEAAYLIASDLEPGQAFSSLNLGRIYIQTGRLDDALKQFRIALTVDPNMAEVYNNIGKIYELKQQYEMALTEYRHAIGIKPYMEAAHSNIGYIFALQKRYDEALKEYDRAIACDPDYDTAYFNRGMTLLATGKRSEALDDFRRALQINPANSEAAAELQRAGIIR